MRVLPTRVMVLRGYFESYLWEFYLFIYIRVMVVRGYFESYLWGFLSIRVMVLRGYFESYPGQLPSYMFLSYMFLSYMFLSFTHKKPNTFKRERTRIYAFFFEADRSIDTPIQKSTYKKTSNSAICTVRNDAPKHSKYLQQNQNKL